MATDFFTWEDSVGTTHILLADCVPSFQDDRTAEVTEHTVEDGSDIADHVIQKSDTISFEIAQTQTPLYEGDGFKFRNATLDVRKSLFKPEGLLFLTTGIGNALGSLFGAASEETSVEINVLQADAPKDRITNIHDDLIRVKEGPFLFTVSFLGRVHPDYVITSLTLTRASGEAGLGRFKIEAKKIRTTETEVVKNPADLRMKPPKPQGKKPAKEQTEAEKTVVKRSALKQLGGLTGLIGGG